MEVIEMAVAPRLIMYMDSRVSERGQGKRENDERCKTRNSRCKKYKVGVCARKRKRERELVYKLQQLSTSLLFFFLCTTVVWL